MVRVTELHDVACRVPGRAQVAFLRTLHRESSILSSEAFNPQAARFLDPRVLSRHAEVGEDEKHPVRREVLRPVKALAAHPPSGAILLRKNLFAPPGPPDHVSRGRDLRIIDGFLEQLGPRQVSDGRLIFPGPTVHRAIRLHLTRTPLEPDRSELVAP